MSICNANLRLNHGSPIDAATADGAGDPGLSDVHRFHALHSGLAVVQARHGTTFIYVTYVVPRFGFLLSCC